ncbi:MscS Mechanosensitive ion channel [Anaeromyxobacter sp. K]|uniref:mechanosensitive ion channel family protein n=1 Tax=Anaeromyxobacter sp. (strain K) TaxID=447217 RepID=UPI00015F8A0A|nr:mechanosensitive ion channel family protein [Anaeromyxobacter sp. K]ACG72170.1 MscS Mechanosensitive ion channel [Anaeromyxobacter sp. K]
MTRSSLALARAAALALAAVLAAPAAAQPGAAAGAPPAAASPRDPAAPPARAPRVEVRVEPEPEARPFFEAHLPAPLRERGPRGLLWWQWLAMPGVVLIAVTLGSVLGWLTRKGLGHLAARTRTTWDDLLLQRIASPLTALWAVGLVTAMLPWLVLPDGAATVVHHLLRAVAFLVVFWGAYRSVGVAFQAMALAPRTATNPGLAAFLPVGRKMAKAAVVAIGLISVLNELGFQVASLLAGLGIGGIAVAFGAQKTVENLFGSVSIGVDQPFRQGDYVNVEGVTGTVESIGMRSTRIRTLDRTLVTIPNGKLSEMRSETFGARDRIRLSLNLGLSYSTSAAQMREVIRRVDALLRAHPRVHPDGIGVRFTALLDSTLNVEVLAWFQTTDWNEFCEIRTEVLLQIMEAVEGAGSSFAFPTRTVQLVSEGGADPARR